MLKRISRILRRPNVAIVEKGFPIFQLQKKQKLLFLEVFKSLFILCYLCSMLDSPGRFFSIRWSTLFQSLENLGKMPLLLPLHAVRFSLSQSSTNNSIFFRPVLQSCSVIRLLHWVFDSQKQPRSQAILKHSWRDKSLPSFRQAQATFLNENSNF